MHDANIVPLYFESGLDFGGVPTMIVGSFSFTSITSSGKGDGAALHFTGRVLLNASGTVAGETGTKWILREAVGD